MDYILTENLKKSGQQTFSMSFDNGSEVLVLPRGGRILGLFSPNSEMNLFWTNPMLKSEDSARKFWARDHWYNTGGDRTWIAPEIDHFFPDYPDLNNYQQPECLENVDYEIDVSSQLIEMSNEFRLRSYRNKKQYDLHMVKTITRASDPLRYENVPVDLGCLEYSGYTLRSFLEINSQCDSNCLGLWNLLQLPHNGQMIIPVHAKTKPRVYFGQLDKDQLVTSDNHLMYKMNSMSMQKMGICAANLVGRTGYLYPACNVDNKYILVIRDFNVNPSGAYIDAPFDSPQDMGDCFQACNVHGEMGTFSEMEYHVPAIGGDDEKKSCADMSQIWAYTGNFEQIAYTSKTLLGVPLNYLQITKAVSKPKVSLRHQPIKTLAKKILLL